MRLRRWYFLLLLEVALPPTAQAQCNSLPIAVADTVDYFGQAISVEPLWNDREPDGEALTLSLLSHTCTQVSAGSPLAVLVENNTVRLLPLQPGYSTTCSVSYRIEDEHGFHADALIQIRELAFFQDGFESGTTTKWQLVTGGSGVEP